MMHIENPYHNKKQNLSRKIAQNQQVTSRKTCNKQNKWKVRFLAQKSNKQCTKGLQKIRQTINPRYIMSKHKKQTLKQTSNSTRLICQHGAKCTNKTSKNNHNTHFAIKQAKTIRTAPYKSSKQNISAFEGCIQNRNI